KNPPVTTPEKKPAPQTKTTKKPATTPTEQPPAEQSKQASKQEQPQKPDEPKPDVASGDKAPAVNIKYDMTEVAPIVTHHRITVGGRLLNYTATAGRLPIKNEEGKIEAEMF